MTTGHSFSASEHLERGHHYAASNPQRDVGEGVTLMKLDVRAKEPIGSELHELPDQRGSNHQSNDDRGSMPDDGYGYRLRETTDDLKKRVRARDAAKEVKQRIKIAPVAKRNR